MKRRNALKHTALGLLGLSMPTILTAETMAPRTIVHPHRSGNIPNYWPNINPELVSEVVGNSHFNLERVKELVEARPELARSVWEWRFGDFESAIGAASHVGRRDIVLYLLNKGARPSIHTFAMLGAHEVIKQMVAVAPGIQTTMGPHGISVLDHAYVGERMKEDLSSAELDNVKRTIDYLESLGDAGGASYIEETKEEQAKFLGDYKYGEGDQEGFSIKLNMRAKMALGPLGGFGGALHKLKENLYTYNGAPSVNVTFAMDGDVVKSLTLTDPVASITASKV